MTVLTFSIDGRPFALPVSSVRAVLPLLPVRHLDFTPGWVAGVFDAFQQTVPVVDLCQLHAGRCCRPAFSTRIIVVAIDAPQGPGLLGLAAELVTDIVEIDEGSARPTGVTREAAWLGRLVSDADGRLVELVDPARLLGDDVRAILYPDA